MCHRIRVITAMTPLLNNKIYLNLYLLLLLYDMQTKATQGRKGLRAHRSNHSLSHWGCFKSARTGTAAHTISTSESRE